MAAIPGVGAPASVRAPRVTSDRPKLSLRWWGSQPGAHPVAQPARQVVKSGSGRDVLVKQP